MDAIKGVREVPLKPQKTGACDCVDMGGREISPVMPRA